MKCDRLVCVEVDWQHRVTHLRNPHQHHQSEGSYGSGLVYWSTPVAGWN